MKYLLFDIKQQTLNQNMNRYTLCKLPIQKQNINSLLQKN